MEYRINPMLVSNVARCLKEEFKLEDKLKDDENPRKYMKSLLKLEEYYQKPMIIIEQIKTYWIK